MIFVFWNLFSEQISELYSQVVRSKPFMILEKIDHKSYVIQWGESRGMYTNVIFY